jgi:hypothetical protein
MTVIAHQTLGQKASPGVSNGSLKHFRERDEVFVLREDRYPCIGAVQHIINPSTLSGSFWSSHANRVLK